MTENTRVPWAAARRKAFAATAAGVLGALSLVAGPMLLAGAAQAAWAPAATIVAGPVKALLPGLAPPATGAPSTSPGTPAPSASTTASPTPRTAPAKPAVTVRPPAPTTAPPTKAAKRAPVQAPSSAAAPAAVHPAPGTTAAPTPTAAAPVSETPWPSYVNTETASTFEPAGADAGSGTGVPGQPAGAQLSLAGEGGTAPGLAWGILMLLGLTVVCGLVVGIYAMGKLRGRPGGAHRHGG